MMELIRLKYGLLILALSLQNFQAIGQQPNDCGIPIDFQIPLAGELYMADPNLSGTPFYPTSDLRKGKVTLNNDQSVDGLLLKYNGFNDQLVWFNESNSRQVQLEKKQLSGFVLSNPNKGKSHRFKKISGLQLPLSNANPAPFFAEVLHEGKVSLYAYRSFITTGKETKSFKNTSRVVDIIRLRTEYFFIFPENEGFSITTVNENQFYGQLYDFNPEAARALSGEITVRNEEDLIRIAKALSGKYDDF